MASPYPKGDDLSVVGIDPRRPGGGREGALIAALTRTEAAGYADGRGGSFHLELEPVRIDEVRRMGDFAPQDHGVAAGCA